MDEYQALASRAVSGGGVEDWYRLGCWLADRRYWGSAAGCFVRVIEGEPGHYRALTNLGWALHQTGRSEEARSRLLAAVAAKEDEGTPHALLSQVCATLGEKTFAAIYGRAAVRHEPQAPINHVALSFALMSAGEWEEGWREYEHRFAYKLPEFLSRPWPLWRGERVGHLYLEAEQGLGDTVMALRWVWRAAGFAERVTLYVQREVYALAVEAMALPDNVTVYPMPRILPGDVGAWCPLMSLPAALGLGGPEDERPYIGHDYARHEKRAPSRVGIVWAGSPVHEQAHHRDCPLVYWLRLAEIPRVELHSLQVGEAAGQMNDLAAHGIVLDRGPELTNMLDTARVIAGLDLVISVDTAVGHLAGAMGVPCWLLINQRGRDFRWGYEGEATGWYPAHRLVRRALDEDWAAVMRRVDGELRRMVA